LYSSYSNSVMMGTENWLSGNAVVWGGRTKNDFQNAIINR